MRIETITNACLNITEQCNMDCVYCFTQHNPNRMPFQVAKDAVDFILNNAEKAQTAGSISFFGGEPLLEWDTIVVPLSKYLREEKNSQCLLSMTSNCSLLDKEKLDFMRKYSIDLLISMDGDKETQDYNRPLKNGQSSFDVLNEKISLIFSYYPKTVFRSTLIPATCHNFTKNLDYAKNIGFEKSFVIINQFEEWPEEKRIIVEKQLRQYSNYLIYCCQNNYKFIQLKSLEQAINKIISINFQSIKNNPQRVKMVDLESHCGLGIKNASINYKGDIYSCQEVPSRKEDREKFYLGNIYNDIDRNKQENLIKEISLREYVYNKEHPEQCKNCKIEAICNNHACLTNNYLKNKDFFAQSDALCWWNNLLVQEAQYICKILGEQNNSLFKEYFKFILTSNGGVFKND